ncbi:MAG: ATP-binding protein [Akkermansia sp.]|nr:ATP-binding protein [Akkermansia sp.]
MLRFYAKVLCLLPFFITKLLCLLPRDEVNDIDIQQKNDIMSKGSEKGIDMYRKGIEKLKAWMEKKRRKPMLLLGARQVGKTWLMQEFARLHYKNVVYVRFDKEPFIKSSFEKDYNVSRLLMDLQLHSDTDIVPGETLILLDEIQECPSALTSLKYFCEEAGEQHIIAAGSLLGVAEHKGTGFPVGKVERMYLGPLSFTEFLMATKQERLLRVLQCRDWETISALHERFEEQLRLYYFIGGMPEAVATYMETKSFSSVREVQLNLLEDYRNDFSKHATTSETHLITQIWNSIPVQLSREDKRFIQSEVSPGVKSDRLRGPIRWLTDAGMVNLVRRVTKPEMPLDGFCDACFKMFFLDVGLLAARCRLRPAALLEGNKVFAQYKGALTEQYVQQQLVTELGIRPYYWSAERASAEIDFLYESESEVIPMEVKAERNLQAKSLQSFYRRYRRPLAVRLSMSPAYAVQDIHVAATKDTMGGSYRLIDMPLYALSLLEEVVCDVLHSPL